MKENKFSDENILYPDKTFPKWIQVIILFEIKIMSLTLLRVIIQTTITEDFK